MKIGIDIDNVIADTFRDLSDYFNEFMGRKVDPSEVVDIFRKERLKLWRYFFNAWRTKVMTRISPIDGAIETIQGWSDKHHIKLITGRFPLFNRQTKSWLKKLNVPYHELHHSREKEKFLKAKDCDIFIEDHFEECELLAEHCDRVFLFDHPWNRFSTKKKNIKRVKNWTEICAIFPR
ncbi:MAG: hypothetical protein U9R38_05540 [Candidatus Margulisiibacteriota bacterium]|nr:hypothetical protein [Candidatus Margulisiibacteriota bacterium]